MEQEQQTGQPIPGWPVEPEFVPERRWNDGGYIPVPQQPQVVNNYYAAPPPARRGLQPGTVIAWAMASAMVVAVLIAVSIAAVAIAASIAGLTVALLILRWVWRDMVAGKASE